MRFKHDHVGYIVLGDGQPLQLDTERGVPERGALFFGGNAATLFQTRARAKGAIDRSQKYWASVNSGRDDVQYVIQRVVRSEVR